MRLVDSDVIIWNWRGRDAAATLLATEPFAISAVTYMELVQGMRNAREFRRLQSDLKLWQVRTLPITEVISRHLLQLADRGTVTQHVGCTAMAEAVRGNGLLDAGAPGVLVHDVGDGLRVHARTPAVKEEALVAADIDPLGPARGDIRKR